MSVKCFSSQHACDMFSIQSNKFFVVLLNYPVSCCLFPFFKSCYSMGNESYAAHYAATPDSSRWRPTAPQLLRLDVLSYKHPAARRQVIVHGQKPEYVTCIYSPNSLIGSWSFLSLLAKMDRQPAGCGCMHAQQSADEFWTSSVFPPR